VTCAKAILTRNIDRKPQHSAASAKDTADHPVFLRVLFSLAAGSPENQHGCRREPVPRRFSPRLPAARFGTIMIEQRKPTSRQMLVHKSANAAIIARRPANTRP
jgi:hypothetical protein